MTKKNEKLFFISVWKIYQSWKRRKEFLSLLSDYYFISLKWLSSNTFCLFDKIKKKTVSSLGIGVGIYLHVDIFVEESEQSGGDNQKKIREINNSNEIFKQDDTKNWSEIKVVKNKWNFNRKSVGESYYHSHKLSKRAEGVEYKNCEFSICWFSLWFFFSPLKWKWRSNRWWRAQEKDLPNQKKIDEKHKIFYFQSICILRNNLLLFYIVFWFSFVYFMECMLTQKS